MDVLDLKMKKRVFIIVLFILLLFLISCKVKPLSEIERNQHLIYQGVPSTPLPQEPPPFIEPEVIPENTSNTTEPPQEIIPTGPVKKDFFMIASQWKFKPDTIVVENGDEVTIFITSLDINDLFEIPDFGISIDLEPQSKSQVTFTVNKTGKFKFRCKGDCTNITQMEGFIYVK